MYSSIFDEAALQLDLGLLDADVVRARRAADSHQHLLRFDLLLLAVDRERNRDAVLRLLDFLDLGVDESVDAALAINPHQLLRNLFVFHRNVARQHFQNGHIRAERFVNAGELHAHRARANDDQRLGNIVQAQHLDVGQDAIIGLHSRQHARYRASRKNHVLRLDRFLLAAFQGNGMDSVFRRAGQFAASADNVDLVLAASGTASPWRACRRCPACASGSRPSSA